MANDTPSREFAREGVWFWYNRARMKRAIMTLVLVFAVAASAAAWAWWPRLPEGLSRRDLVIGDREVTMLVMRLPRDGEAYRLVADPERPKSVRAWREKLGALIVFNGSYFNEDGSPSGYWNNGEGTSAVPWPAVDVQTDPYGYTFALTVRADGLEMRYLPDGPIAEPEAATFLSFPTLVAGGEPIVASDSGLLARRTAVAEDADGNDYAVVTEKGTLTLYELSRWLAEQPENFVVAGNLDGGPSAGISVENERQDVEVLSVAVPNVIAIYSRLP